MEYGTSCVFICIWRPAVGKPGDDATGCLCLPGPACRTFPQSLTFCLFTAMCLRTFICCLLLFYNLCFFFFFLNIFGIQRSTVIIIPRFPSAVGGVVPVGCPPGTLCRPPTISDGTHCAQVGLNARFFL